MVSGNSETGVDPEEGVSVVAVVSAVTGFPDAAGTIPDGVGHKYSANRSNPLIRRPWNGRYGKFGVKHEDTTNRK